ncbi:MAG: 5'-nucleotidase C-terminal domain-containing protein [Candidatus Melainabacteria bacterium]|nr:5'-nucleotidase C-terminal domain-containing protein [Candidatus Melainabacteria bacterium]
MVADQITVKEHQSPLLTSKDSSDKWREELGSVHFRQAASEVVSSIAAGTSGAIAFGILSASGPYGKALSIPVAMLAGGITKYGVKDGIQEALLDNKDHTVSNADFAWGAVDGLSGIAASLADQRASTAFLRSTGLRELGAKTSLETAELAGKQLVEGSAWKGIQHNVFRGLAGGATGSATWSAFHQTHDNWHQITTNPVSGIETALKGVAIDTAFGTVAGGVLGGGFTALRRSPEIVGRTVANIKGDAGSLKMNEFVINDFHSNLDRLPQLKTKLDERTAISAAKGIPSEFNVAGDALSGHVNFAYTNGGEVENQALAKMGLKNIIPGNHEYDAPGGRFIPERYPAVMEPILRDNPQISLLNANLDLSAYPQYAKLTKPYVVHEIQGPNGPERVATVGLITEEGAVGNIRYEDAAQTAIKTVRELNAQGIKNIKLLTHLGLDEDKRLAQELLDNNLVVAKISGGHTHDVVASPIWVSEKQSLADKLKFWKAPTEIPITQAGSSGNYLSENHIVFNPDGSANRWLTTGKLHGVRDVAPDPNLKQFIDSQTAEIGALKSTTRFDEPGNFVQVSGMKYSFDLTKQPWNRVSDVSVKMPDGSYQPIQDSGQYKVVTRFHPVDKWNKAGLFGEGISEDQIYAKLNAKPIPVSQVDLLGEHIQGRTINPLVDSKVEGRVNNVTPVFQDVTLRPQTSIVGFSTLAAQDATTDNNSKNR